MQPAPSARVVEDEVAEVVADGERAVVRAEGDAFDALAGGAQDADRGRALDQRGEQAAAGLDGVVERYALPGQQQRAVQRGLDQGAGAEPLSVGRGRLFASVATLLESDEAGDQ